MKTIEAKRDEKMSVLGEEIRSAYEESEWSGKVMLEWAEKADELLEAAKNLVEELDRDVFDAGIEWAAQPALEEAIAKAEGR